MSMPANNKVTLHGSEIEPVAGSRPIGPAHPDERIEVTVRLRPRTAITPEVQARTMHPGPPNARDYLTREQLAADHGASQDDIDRVEAFARAHGLRLAFASEGRRSVWLSGTVAAMESAFGVTLQEYELPGGGTYRGRSGSMEIPADLADVIVGVFGLDNRPAARPTFRIVGRDRRGRPTIRPAAGFPSSSFTPPQIAQLYDFPAGLDGTGECLAILELGGGYDPSDLQTYFSAIGVPGPTIRSVLVDGATNSPTGDPSGPDGEVALDIEVAGAVAPGAKIVVYFAPNTVQGFLDAITKAVHDTVNRPSILSISWGSAEANWTAQAMEQFDQAFRDASAVGVTVCVSSGDSGSDGGVGDGQAHVDFPASSPYVLACGGTSVQVSGGSIVSEVVWNDGPGNGATGGGISTQFPVPSYQDGFPIPPSANPGGGTGRGVPDIAADADPNTGYQVRVDGTDTVVGGTSAVAPLWAGLIARLNQSLGKPVGFLNPNLYGPAYSDGAFREITSGNNGAYSAGPTWNACTGLGVADGTKILTALRPNPAGA